MAMATILCDLLSQRIVSAATSGSPATAFSKRWQRINPLVAERGRCKRYASSPDTAVEETRFGELHPKLEELQAPPTATRSAVRKSKRTTLP